MITSIIKEIGELAFFEEEPILILFNSTAPDGLREVCVIHDFEEEPEQDLLREGSKVLFGAKEYQVVAVGNVANSTLRELGHASFYFDFPKGQALLPGAVSLAPSEIPSISTGDKIKFVY